MIVDGPPRGSTMTAYMDSKGGKTRMICPKAPYWMHVPTCRGSPLLPLLEAEHKKVPSRPGEAPTANADTHACTTNHHAEAAGSRMCAFVAATRPRFAGPEDRYTVCIFDGDVAQSWICYAGLDSMVACTSE
ncbi:hypothetical protein B5807_00261 [Epicoccum nigrum]|uniref:Uncharacterized protein n=1 Tax=Epicoccum nigrum TaxID=105696 RepID=A0A1Y2MC91_EPING|nr:hypothetical protein B5807_00261 [Epicoccum nigrum]